MEISELKQTLEAMFEIKTKIEGLDSQKSELNIELSKLKEKAMVELEKNEMKNFKVGNHQIIKVDKKSVKILDQEAFKDWLEDRGKLRDALKITAATATKIFNEEYENAKENQDMSILTDGIAGLSEPATYSTISMRSK